MKRIIPLLLACLLLCACGTPAEPTETTTVPTTEATTAPTTEATTQPPTTETTEPPTTAPTEPPVIYRNPLNGEVLDAPYEGRVFAVTINNIEPAMPNNGVGQADIYFEMFCNDYATRGLALFSNVTEVPSIGSIRSTRYNFTDLALAYDLIVCHASATDTVLADMRKSGIDNMLADVPIGYRDQVRYKTLGYSWEHCLFATGQSLWDAAAERGFDLAVSDKDYGMTFAEEAIPEGGQAAAEIEIVFTHKGRTKTTTMKYDQESATYIYNQFGEEMVDGNSGEPEGFRNVIVILAPTENQGVYHVADLYGSGEGYFACGGQIVPILWTHENETDPFTFTLTDGTPLVQGVGSTFVAIAPTGSPVNVS